MSKRGIKELRVAPAKTWILVKWKVGSQGFILFKGTEKLIYNYGFIEIKCVV